MNLYLIRHGHACPTNQDMGRPLTEEGHHQIRLMAEFLTTLEKLHISEIWCSSLQRSVQSAELFQKILPGELSISPTPSLEPEANLQSIVSRITAQTHPILIVGHMPYLSYLSSFLVSGDPYKIDIDFDLAEMICLSLNHATSELRTDWEIKWKISPELLKGFLNKEK